MQRFLGGRQEDEPKIRRVYDDDLNLVIAG